MMKQPLSYIIAVMSSVFCFTKAAENLDNRKEQKSHGRSALMSSQAADEDFTIQDETAPTQTKKTVSPRNVSAPINIPALKASSLKGTKQRCRHESGAHDIQIAASSNGGTSQQSGSLQASSISSEPFPK